jgi:hypothetical protein
MAAALYQNRTHALQQTLAPFGHLAGFWANALNLSVRRRPRRSRLRTQQPINTTPTDGSAGLADGGSGQNRFTTQKMRPIKTFGDGVMTQPLTSTVDDVAANMNSR